jgi:hypothetical protein
MRGPDDQASDMFSDRSPKQRVRALLLQTLYTVRSERLLMEEIDRSNATHRHDVA